VATFDHLQEVAAGAFAAGGVDQSLALRVVPLDGVDAAPTKGGSFQQTQKPTGRVIIGRAPTLAEGYSGLDVTGEMPVARCELRGVVRL
jgi:hypothetical protein